MKALKGVLIYIGIVLAIILGAGIILFAVMYFVPSFRIMGVGVTHVKENYTGDTILFSDYSYNSVELSISSNKVPVTIVSNTEHNGVDYSLNVATFGISYDITEYRVIRDVEVVDDVLKISLNVTEPEGLISLTGSGAKVAIPSSLKYALVCNTKSGDIKVLSADDSSVNISKLTVSTNSGNFDIENSSSGDLGTLSLSVLNLSTTSGNFDFRNFSSLSCSSLVKINSDKGKFSFKNVDASFDIRGAGVNFSAESVNATSEGLTFMSESGNVNIGILNSGLNENTIITDTCGVKINTIYGKTGIITSSGSVELGETNDTIAIESEHGKVDVTKAKADISVITHYGDISVDAYDRNGSFKSKRGNIKVNSTGDYVQDLGTYIENVEGNISIVNKVNKLRIKTLGSSKVSVTFEQIKGELAQPFRHSIELDESGSGEVFMPTNPSNIVPFRFTAKGNISGTLWGMTNSEGNASVTQKDTVQYYPSDDYKTQCDNSCEFMFSGTIEFKSYTAVSA